MDIVSVPGRLVRDPATRRVVDQAGLSINPDDPYWSRLLVDGDVVAKRARKSAAKEPRA